MLVLRTAALSSALLLAIAGSAEASARQAVCVSCSGPDVTYRCEVEMPAGSAPAQAVQLFCITRLAQDGRHQACGARRGAGECVGVPMSLRYEGPTVAREAELPAGGQGGGQGGAAWSATSTPAGGHPPSVKPPDDAAKAAKPKGEPKTLVEATGRAYEASKDGLNKAGTTVVDGAKSAGSGVKTAVEKTGETVGNAAKSTWKCLSSLFSECK